MWKFFFKSLLLGVGLTMDAFSVSIADGLNEPNLKKRKMFLIALVFAVFQFAMPMIGWLCVHTIVEKFMTFRYAIPWIALFLLGYIGGKMIYENLYKRKHKVDETVERKTLSLWALFVQGIATSIDALSVGFTISNYNLNSAFYACTIIAIVTLIFCIVGVFFGKKISSKISTNAELIGGIILICIGLEIFVSNIIELYF